MKTFQLICITLAVMSALVNCASEAAFDYLVTTSNGDPNSCLLNLTYSISSDKVTFTVDQIIPDPINRSCTYQDIVTAPIFYNTPFTPKNVNLTPLPTNPNRLVGVFTYADFTAQIGQSCFLSGTWLGQESWTCKFKWSSIWIYLDIWKALPSNTTFDGNWSLILFPELVSTKQSTKYGVNIWIPNPNFQKLIGRLEDGCGPNNWDNVINSLSTHVTIMGTEWLSNTVDLYNYFQGAIQYTVLVLRNGQPPLTYKSTQTSFYPFNSPGVNTCTDLGITYGSFLPNLAYCQNGCSITLLLYTNTGQYALTTNGISTAANRLRALLRA